MLRGMIDLHENPVEGYFDQQMTPNPCWWERLFTTIDVGDAAGFVEMLTPDAEFRFGNAAPVQGCDAIGAAVAGFFGAIHSSQHRLFKSWCCKEAVGCEGEVTYTRHDGSVVRYFFANIFQLRGEKICSYHIYIDISTLFSALA